VKLAHGISAVALAALALPALAHDVTFIGTLSTAGEAALNPPSQGTGTVVVIFNDDDFTMDVSVTFSGVSGNTSEC